MTYYVCKFASRDYFVGFLLPLQPLLGVPEWALPFPSEKAAFDCVPAVLHSDVEVVDESARRKDAQDVCLWPVTSDPSSVKTSGGEEMHAAEVI